MGNIKRTIATACWALLIGILPVSAQKINYTLKKAGDVSIGIYDASGKMVRTLLSAKPQNAGPQSITWDGKDDDGKRVPDPSRCTWKLLQTPGFKAEYLMKLANTLPDGPHWWETALGNHQGPRSVALDGTGLYIGAGVSENVCNGMKMTLDGRKRIWSAWQPESFMGRYSTVVMDGWVYFLQQNAKLAAHPVDKPNGLFESIPTVGSNGFVYDVLGPKSKRPGADDWSTPGTQAMDMAGTKGNLILSYKDQNVVQWRTAKGGKELATVKVPEPLGVAADNAGNALVISGNKVVKVNRNGQVQNFITTGLNSPYRLDIDPDNGDIWVAEAGKSQQVKRFNAKGELQRTYGEAGGRKYGIYHPENFLTIEDIISDGQGGFIIVESVAPRRVARFSKEGKLISEWYGGTHWVPTASPDPEDPTVVWSASSLQELMRLKLDYKTKTWKIHSIYKYSGLANGLIGNAFGGGYGDWHVRKRNKITYLIRRGSLEVMKVDEQKWRLIPLVVGSFSKEVKGEPQAFLWTDQNGDGEPQPAEYKTYNWGEWKWNAMSLQAPEGFDYYRFSLNTGKIFHHKVVDWNEVGAPVYGDLKAGEDFAAAAGFDGSKLYQNPPGFFSKCKSTGNLYFMVNTHETEWANASFNKMFAYNPEGKLIWGVGKHANRPAEKHKAIPAPGTVYTFKNNIGVIKDVVVATDFDGGWDGSHPAITYAWDQNGLFAGNLFENIVSAAAPMWKYSHSGDNAAGEMCVEPATGEVLYFAGGENEVRVYRVSGWKDWVRMEGKVQ